MSVCPAQKSMSIARVNLWQRRSGDPLVAGSQIRGMPMVSATSVLPQAKIFPLGRRLMCSGTMSQSTTGPHFRSLRRSEAVTARQAMTSPTLYQR